MRIYARLTVVLLALAAMNPLTSNVRAGLVGGSLSFDARADQTVTITPNSALIGSGISAGDQYVLSALGSVSIGWAADADGDRSTPLTSFSASFSGREGTFGVGNGLGRYLLRGVGEGPGANFNGSLDNIVESGGELVSATWTLNTTFSFRFLDTLPQEAVVYSKGDPASLATFTGTIRGGEATIGEIFTSNGDVEGFLALGGDPADDPLAAISSSRTVTAVPEPSSLVALGAISCIVTLRRRRR